MEWGKKGATRNPRRQRQQQLYKQKRKRWGVKSLIRTNWPCWPVLPLGVGTSPVSAPNLISRLRRSWVRMVTRSPAVPHSENSSPRLLAKGRCPTRKSPSPRHPATPWMTSSSQWWRRAVMTLTSPIRRSSSSTTSPAWASGIGSCPSSLTT